MIKSLKKLIGILIIIVIAIVILIPQKYLAINQLEIIAGVLVFLYFGISLYMDITNRLYTTSKFIILVDLINIILLIILCFLYFNNYDKTNMDALWNRKISIQRCASLLILMVPIKYILENQKFKK